jgi:hypothetical protein
VRDFQPNLRFQQIWPLVNVRAKLCATIAAGILAVGASLPLQSQSQPKASASVSKPSTIKSFRIIQEKDGPAIEILSTKPLVPSIQSVNNPERLVIDLPNARLDTQPKRINVQSDQISSIRANQFQENPPIARVVVDLLAPRAYTWDAAGNRLVVHLGKNPNQASDSPFQPPAVPALVSAPQPVVSSVRGAGPLTLSENNGAVGSTVAAGPDTAVLNLSSGGEVRVCPGTTVSVTPSQSRHNLMLSMNTGALEAHFGLDASSDTVMTPDFRILLVGPGEFHYAISADNQGNTCVRALPGNTASAIVTELLGDRTYQVKATDQLMFRSGQLDRVDMKVPLECGCPPPRESLLRATSNLPAPNPVEASTTSKDLPPVNTNPSPVAEVPRTENSTASGVPPLSASIAPNELHVQVEAPFVFHPTGPPPAPVEDVRALPMDTRPLAAPPLAAPLPPSNKKTKSAAGENAPASHPQQRGFFQKIGGFLASLFR